MANIEKLLEAARNNPNNLNFGDFETLVRRFGFLHARTSGSHRIYKDAMGRLLNIQPRKDGKAKHYQVKEFLRLVEPQSNIPRE